MKTYRHRHASSRLRQYKILAKLNVYRKYEVRAKTKLKEGLSMHEQKKNTKMCL